MERLTDRFSDGEAFIPNYVSDLYGKGKVAEKLAYYEDLEEQGRLICLPCKVGDIIYRFWYVGDTPYRIQTQRIRNLSQVVAIMEDGSFGKTVFLTQEEAEQALAEMKGE